MAYLKAFLSQPWDADDLFMSPKTTVRAIGIVTGGVTILWFIF